MVATATASSSSTNGKASKKKAQGKSKSRLPKTMDAPKKKAKGKKAKAVEQTATAVTETPVAAPIAEVIQPESKPDIASDSPAKVGLTGDEAIKLASLEKACQFAESHWNSCKQETKEAKEAFDEAVSNLRSFIRVTSPQDMPLFEQEKSATVTSADGSMTATITPFPTADDSWKSTLINRLMDYGLKQSVIDKLVEARITTLGEMADFTSKNYQSISDIKGIGSGTAEKISDAMEKYWAANPLPVPAVEETKPAKTEAEDQLANEIEATCRKEGCKLTTDDHGLTHCERCSRMNNFFKPDPHASKSDEFRAGYQAFKDDFPITDNPEARGSDNWQDWRSGWQEAESEQTQNLDSNDPPGE